MPSDLALQPNADVAARQNLTHRSFDAARWVALGTSGNVVLNFVVFLVLARLLLPEQFGLIAVAVVFIDIMQIVTRGGLPERIVQTDVLEESFADTAFWVSLGMGCAYAMVLVALSWPIAWILDLPELQPVLAALAPVFIVSALGAIHEARLQRSLGFGKLAIRSFASNVIGGCVAVAMALEGFGVWSLVAQRLIAATATTTLTWIAYRWVPQARIDRDAARRQVGFGARVFSTHLLLIASIRSQEVIAAYFLSTADVGLLRMAWRCIDLVSQIAVIPLSSVALATYARLQDEPEELAAAFYRFLATSALLAMPAFLGMAAVAPTLIPTLFGEQWSGAASVLRILSLLGPEFVATSLLWMIFTALNRTGTALGLAAAQFGVNVAAAMVLAPFGLPALVLGHVVRAYLFSPFIVVRLSRFAAITNGAIMRVLMPSTACALAMAALVLLLQDPIDALLGPLFGLAACIALGILAYGGLAYLFMREALRSATGLLGRRVGAKLATAT